ncbi:hypothetical protein EXIGLDRAFT_769628 [Exidia glandulosa HHB12029]|uniref:Uncharacterized protein n=1 Tax=Exidia glandulosa HHB12029 TaxID=1314781 RepID=A0A165HCT4_EXIGL|nr:hypothetical protein EXIGLDRAFT_769628 [Exidia glandulosa HHB12029]
MPGQTVIFAGYKLTPSALSAYRAQHKDKLPERKGYNNVDIVALLRKQLGFAVALVEILPSPDELGGDDSDIDDHDWWVCIYAFPTQESI